MDYKLRHIAILFLFIIGLFVVSWAQSEDWRNAKNGLSIYANGYCDQPYIIVLKNGKWLCVFTTNEGLEGSKGQHIVSCLSNNQGKTWTKPVKIEKPGIESASWAMPYLTDYGRVYVFYNYNGDKIHNLGTRVNIREDMLGWYCFKYSDDEGKTWSERHRLNVRTTNVDRNNDWQGSVQMMWGIGKPVDVDEGMMFAFTKIGKYLNDNSEGWFFSCDNINTEKNIAKLNWQNLPESQVGLKNEELGSINAEQNIFQMNNGSIYCMYRTASGYPAESYSFNGGKSWTLPVPPKYQNGEVLKNPRACPRIWKCKNDNYLLWYHNNGANNYSSRNPAWISGGIEKDGKILWSQPEILLYEDDPDVRMSYPDLIEQNGKYWITETNKENARCHQIPDGFFDMIWSQSERNVFVIDNLIVRWDENEFKTNHTFKIPQTEESQYQLGFTFDFKIDLTDLQPGQVLFVVNTSDNNKIVVQTGNDGSVEMVIKNNEVAETWNSDPGLIKAGEEQCIAISVDNGPKIIQFIVDGTVCNGGDFKQFGWKRFKTELENISLSEIETGDLCRQQIMHTNTLKSLSIYNRPLMNTEIIGNHRNAVD